MHRLALLLLPLLACAPLDRLRMSESCRSLYDACLNGCPTPPRTPDPAAGSDEWQTTQAACTDACNAEAKRCQ